MRLDAEAPKRRGIGLTPLIDVVFLLLLFFMLASTFTRFAAVEVNVGGEAGIDAAEAPKILLSVAASGHYQVNGTETEAANLAEALRAAAGDEPGLVLVRGIGDATMQDIVEALENASRAGVGDVVLMR